MSMLSKLHKYEEVGIDSSVHSADAHKLVLLLYQGALLSIAAARNHLLNNEIAAKGKSISQAISIIEDGLMASLNLSVGGELVQNLSALYAYMSARLLEANLRNDVALLDEISKLLIELRGGWEAIRPGESGTVSQSSPAVRENVVALNVRGNEGVSPGVRQALNAYQQI
jgi:flagellar protein FliS